MRTGLRGLMRSRCAYMILGQPNLTWYPFNFLYTATQFAQNDCTRWMTRVTLLTHSQNFLTLQTLFSYTACSYLLPYLSLSPASLPFRLSSPSLPSIPLRFINLPCAYADTCTKTHTEHNVAYAWGFDANRYLTIGHDSGLLAEKLE